MNAKELRPEDTGKLGFGLMRLPRKGLGIDVAQTSQMVDLFLEAGFTYFDTAHVYPGSEEAIRKALVERHPRESFTLATKLFAMTALSEKAARQQFTTSLERTGAGYIDYYLLHTLMENNYRKYEKFHLWDFVQEEKEKGRIRHVGFSFHDGPELLEKILQAHPEVDFVQLQINYADWERPSVTSRANYEVARKHGKQIVVMEPVKGGALAKPPKEIQKMFLDYAPNRSFASWAIRFVASLEGILTVLSGMSNVAQMEDNLSYMKDFQPLNEEERQIIRKAQEILGRSATIPCTGCGYCMKGCPKQIPIPEVFAAMNRRLGDGQLAEASEAYAAIREKGPAADACVACGQCENVCPQHIPVIEKLKECHEAL
ncbi:MAG: aldo/keto reductase [Lachnospiraceae bacterium]|nr:aldo/keto reductase [Lachnospiraceae bacterium]